MARESPLVWRTMLPSMRRVALVWPWMTPLMAAPPADPATAGFPIRLPEIVPTRVPPVDCEDENTLTFCRTLPVIGVATVPLLMNLNVRFDDVSCVKLAWIPLLTNVLPETVIVPTVAVSCAGSRAPAVACCSGTCCR